MGNPYSQAVQGISPDMPVFGVVLYLPRCIVQIGDRYVTRWLQSGSGPHGPEETAASMDTSAASFAAASCVAASNETSAASFAAASFVAALDSFAAASFAAASFAAAFGAFVRQILLNVLQVEAGWISNSLFNCLGLFVV